MSLNSACLHDYARVKAEEISEINIGFNVYKRFVLEDLSEDDLSETEILLLERMEMILESRNRPVDVQDLAILEGAIDRLADQDSWDQADDRKCEVSDKKFSLYCTLYFASIDVTGEYQHRRTVIQEVRFAVEEASDGREFEHRLMDFNNHPTTTFENIIDVLRNTKEKLKHDLNYNQNVHSRDEQMLI